MEKVEQGKNEDFGKCVKCRVLIKQLLKVANEKFGR
jgi:hypothetical protein